MDGSEVVILAGCRGTTHCSQRLTVVPTYCGSVSSGLTVSFGLKAGRWRLLHSDDPGSTLL